MKILLVLLSFVFAASCVQDFEQSVEVEKPELAKIIDLSGDNAAGSMIVYFDDDAVTRVEAGVSRSGATRSGIAQFDAALEEVGVERIERVFLPNRFEDRLRAEGMHRWYVVYFDTNTDLRKAAELFAAVAEVEKVQYNANMYNVDGEVPAQSATQAQSASATRGKLYSAFNDPDSDKQWHYINVGNTSIFSGIKAGADVNVGEAWNITTGDSRVIVAIVDGMVKYDHPDLADNMWVNTAEKNGTTGVDDDNNGIVDDIYGVNFVTQAYDGSTALQPGFSDHGTHVAGTVAAVNNNGKGACGVAGGSGKGDGVRLMSCQVFYEPYYNEKDKPSNWPSGTEAVTSRAFQYAADNGAAIAQCSYGYSSKMTSDNAYARGSVEKEAIDYFIKYGGGDVLTGGLPIFAAGNNQLDYASYPGAYRDFLCVTAMSCDYTPAYYTNFGPGSNIVAPGGDFVQSYYTDRAAHSAASVYSTTFLNDQVPPQVVNGYGYKQGTSMACPHVSGIAALAISHALNIGKKMTAIELRSILLGSTHDIDSYCVGQKQSIVGDANSAQLVQISNTRAKGKMGVGYIDAFKVLMNVQGTPCLTVRTGAKQALDISDVIGGNPAALTFINGGVSMSQADRTRLGVEGDITISSTGKLQIKCNNIGSGIVKITFIAGGTAVGTNEATGGMSVTRNVAILSRGFATNGGWL